MTLHRILRLGHLGDGIAEGPVYVPRTLPGEGVEGELDGDVLTGVRIVEPSANRIAPRCAHARTCGGCQLQHASDNFVQTWKQDTVAQALQAQGLQPEFRPQDVSPPNTRRRATFAARRTRSGAMVGFHTRQSDTIVEVTSCDVLDPSLLAVIPAVRDLAKLGASRKHSISVQVTTTAGGVDMSVQDAKPLSPDTVPQVGTLAEAYGLSRITWNDDVLVQRAPSEVDLGPARVPLPAGAFLQATAQGQAALTRDVLDILRPAQRVADLFAGCGTFALPLAQTAEVLAVEAEARMLDALQQGWRHAAGLKDVQTQTRDLFRDPLQASELTRFDGIALDPPRAGAQAQVATLAEAKVPRVAYVSCNPQSFARDARCLVDAGYRLDWVRVVDQFRWSTHIELVGAFVIA